jgi:polysaccharide deacetylase 2 family uncharacterized protein YibQ
MTKQTKKRTTKPTKRRPKKTDQFTRLKRLNTVLFIIIIILCVALAFFYFSQQKRSTPKVIQQPIQKEIKKEPKPDQHNIIEKIDPKKLQTSPIEELKKSIQQSPVLKKAYEEYTAEFEKEYIPEIPSKKEAISPASKLPKISVVIDDVTLQSQINKLNAIDYKINMAFLPPTKLHPNSAKIAQNVPFHLIHFPMQATSFKFEEENTLHITDTYEEIEQEVKRLKALYPNANYTNNHTGSKFTAHDASMDKLFKALKKYDFTFLDSRTTANSVAKKYALKHEVPFLTRNIFLDNNLEYNYIQNQLKKAINIAHKTGYAIAIGHPHDITIKVLKESKALFEGLDIVYLSEIPKE